MAQNPKSVVRINKAERQARKTIDTVEVTVFEHTSNVEVAAGVGNWLRSLVDERVVHPSMFNDLQVRFHNGES